MDALMTEWDISNPNFDPEEALHLFHDYIIKKSKQFHVPEYKDKFYTIELYDWISSNGICSKDIINYIRILIEIWVSVELIYRISEESIYQIIHKRKET